MIEIAVVLGVVPDLFMYLHVGERKVNPGVSDQVSVKTAVPLHLFLDVHVANVAREHALAVQRRVLASLTTLRATLLVSQLTRAFS